jgi:predicted acylesterase/phospholipase RssA
MTHTHLEPSKETVPDIPKPSKGFALIMKGGGAKGLAYLGALQVLQEYYTFTWFVGTSAGAITAVLLGAGYSADELVKVMKDTSFREFKDVNLLKLIPNIIIRKGLYSGDKLKGWVEKMLNDKLEFDQ